MNAAQILRALPGRLGEVRVGARRELEVSRHVVRGEPAYVIRDPTTFQSHQLSAAGYQVFAALDERLCLREVVARLRERNVAAAEDEGEFYRYVLQLASMGLLSSPIDDGGKLHARRERRRAAARRGWLATLLFWRIPLWQPDAFLTRTIPLAAPLFTRGAFTGWCLAVLAGVALVLRRANEFFDPLTDMLALRKLPLLWGLFVVLKAWHELGHGYACKRYGGRVPEIGVNLFLFTPCAYVDASCAWGFSRRLERVVVSLAGMYFESLAALVALVVWSLTEPSLLHSAAHQTVVLSTIVTVGFNFNPLMRYDGYFVLSDVIGAPNLAQRAANSLRSLLSFLAYGVRLQSLAEEGRWRWALVGYGMASAAYRLLLLAAMCGAIAINVPAVGPWLAAGLIGSMAVPTARRIWRFVIKSPELAGARVRASIATIGLGFVLFAGLFMCPFESPVRAWGVVERAYERVVRAESRGFLLSPPDDLTRPVTHGSSIATLENVDLVLDVERKRAALTLGRLQLAKLAETNRHAAAATSAQVEQLALALDEAERRAAGLVVRAPCDGWLTDAEMLTVSQQFIERGQPLAVVSSGPWVVRAAVTAEELADGLPKPGQAVEVLTVGDAGRSFSGVVTRVAPAGGLRIRDAALTQLGGGEIVVDPDSKEAQQPFFEITISLEADATAPLVRGTTAIVRIDSSDGGSSLGQRLYRRGLRFLRRLQAAP